MRTPESEIGFDSLNLRQQIEAGIAPALLETDDTNEFEVSFPIPGPGHHHAELHVWGGGDSTLVTIHIRLQDLRALDKDWDGFTHPKPAKSPRPFETELRDHGEEYESYRDVVVEGVTAELGLKNDYSISDAISGGDEPVFTCQEYDGAHQNFGPDLSEYAPYLCGFETDAFWELSE